MRKVSLLLAVVSIVGLLAGIPVLDSAQAAPIDWDIADGHYFTQTNGQAEGMSMTGFSVTNKDGVPFWTEFQRLGGVNRVGYPMSRRFEWDGFTTQVFQKAVFQWRPDVKQVYFINVFDQMNLAGKDTWLESAKSTPKPLDGSTFDAGKTWDQIVAGRLALLNDNPAIKAVYNSATDPMTLYGLPTSKVVDNGNHYAIRLQRAVIQQWKIDVPWAKAGQATIANGGDVAVQAGMFAANITNPMANANDDALVPAATPTPTATPRPATTYSLRGAVRYAPNAGNQWVEGRIYNTDGSPRNGVKVRVSTPDGSWSVISRPSGNEGFRADPAGVWAVSIRSGASSFLNYWFYAEVVDDNGTAVTSERITFYMDSDTSSPEKR
ncbi:MAG: hypothetical protein ACYC7H_05045, partial [Chloroflexota bacterium]